MVPKAHNMTYQDRPAVLDDAQHTGREVVTVTDTLLRGLAHHETLRAPFPAILVFPLLKVPLRLRHGHRVWPLAHLPAHPAFPPPPRFRGPRRSHRRPAASAVS